MTEPPQGRKPFKKTVNRISGRNVTTQSVRPVYNTLFPEPLPGKPFTAVPILQKRKEKMYPRSGFRSGGTYERTLVPEFVPGEHSNVPSFRFSSTKTTFLENPPFCQPAKFATFYNKCATFYDNFRLFVPIDIINVTNRRKSTLRHETFSDSLPQLMTIFCPPLSAVAFWISPTHIPPASTPPECFKRGQTCTFQTCTLFSARIWP